MTKPMAKLLGAVAFLLAAVAIVLIVTHSSNGVAREPLAACIHDALIKEAHVDEEKAAKLANEYSTRASGDGGAAPTSLGVTVTNRTLTSEALQAMSDTNVARVIDSCAAAHNAAPPDALVTAAVKTKGMAVAGAHVFNVSDSNESCDSKIGTGDCPLLLHGVKRSKTYSFGVVLPNYSVAANGFSVEQLANGVTLELTPNGRKSFRVRVVRGESDMPGATVHAVADDGDLRNADCNAKGRFDSDCAQSDTGKDGTVVFFYSEPVTTLSLEVEYQGTTKALYRKNREDILEPTIVVHWPPQGDSTSGLPIMARGAAAPRLPDCTDKTKNGIHTALINRTRQMPSTIHGDITLKIQVDSRGNVVSVGGDTTNPLFAQASAALTSNTIDAEGACTAAVSWSR